MGRAVGRRKKKKNKEKKCKNNYKIEIGDKGIVVGMGYKRRENEGVGRVLGKRMREEKKKKRKERVECEKGKKKKKKEKKNEKNNNKIKRGDWAIGVRGLKMRVRDERNGGVGGVVGEGQKREEREKKRKRKRERKKKKIKI